MCTIEELKDDKEETKREKCIEGEDKRIVNAKSGEEKDVECCDFRKDVFRR